MQDMTKVGFEEMLAKLRELRCAEKKLQQVRAITGAEKAA